MLGHLTVVTRGVVVDDVYNDGQERLDWIHLVVLLTRILTWFFLSLFVPQLRLQ